MSRNKPTLTSRRKLDLFCFRRDYILTDAKRGDPMSDDAKLSYVTREQQEKFASAIPRDASFADIAAMFLLILDAYNIADDSGIELLEMTADALSDMMDQSPFETMH